VDKRAEILEAHHVTGDDCFVLKVAARSMPHLEEVVGAISGLGGVSTSIVYSTTLTGRVVDGQGSSNGGGASA